MIEKLERVPEVGDVVELEDGTCLTVELMDKNHIERIRMVLPEKATEDQDENSSADNQEPVEETEDRLSSQE